MANNTLEDEIEEVGKLIKEKSEMAEVMDNLDSDRLDKETNMSSVDFNTRLTDMEIGAILVIDELQRLGIFPKETGITRQKKRLAISLQGKGREEKVRILSADRDFKASKSFSERLGGMFQRQG